VRRVLGLALLFVLASPVAAHDVYYAGGVDSSNDLAAQAPAVGCEDIGSAGIGIICYRAGHIEPGFAGDMTIQIHDDLNTAVGALYCQDANSDAICGNDAEPFHRFCGEETFYVPGSGGSLEIWDPFLDVWVYLDGAVSGLPVGSPCATISVAFTGFVQHY